MWGLHETRVGCVGPSLAHLRRLSAPHTAACSVLDAYCSSFALYPSGSLDGGSSEGGRFPNEGKRKLGRGDVLHESKVACTGVQQGNIGVRGGKAAVFQHVDEQGNVGQNWVIERQKGGSGGVYLQRSCIHNDVTCGVRDSRRGEILLPPKAQAGVLPKPAGHPRICQEDVRCDKAAVVCKVQVNDLDKTWRRKAVL